MPDVSVVVIFKDAEDFLEEAIERPRPDTLRLGAASRRRWIDGQGHVHRVACCRGGSTTRSLPEHPGHANLGMSTTRNLGLSHAQGEFVGFLDADDMLFPPALEQQVALLRDNPRVGMVYGPLEYWYGGPRSPKTRRATSSIRSAFPPNEST